MVCLTLESTHQRIGNRDFLFRALWATTLGHEAGDDPMEFETIKEPQLVR